MKEKITEILSEYVIHCDTEKKAMELLRILHSYGYVWSSGCSLLAFSYWKRYKGNTYYMESECPYKDAILFGTIAINPGKEIITFDEFKEQLNMEKEVKIQVPEGYEIDKKNSTFECIKFKPIKKVETYDDVARALFSGKLGYYINTQGEILSVDLSEQEDELTNCVTRKQGEKLLAINQLMNVAYYLNKGWEPDWATFHQPKFYIAIENGCIKINKTLLCQCPVVVFLSRETAKRAVEILGEETIRKALGDY